MRPTWKLAAAIAVSGFAACFNCAAEALTCNSSNSCTSFPGTAGPIDFQNMNSSAEVFVTATPADVYYFDAQNPLGSQGQEAGGIETFLGLSSDPTSVSSATFSGNKTGGTLSGDANIFAIHFDHQELLVVYSSGISSFSISGLGNGDLSDIVSFCDLSSCDPNQRNGGGDSQSAPLPAALPLMGSVLGFGYLVSGWRRRRRTALAA